MAIKPFALGRLESGKVRLLGTCFLVRANTFATAAHNLDANDTKLVLVLPQDLNDFNSYQIVSPSNLTGVPLSLKDIDPLHDLAVLTCGDGANITHPQIPTLASTDTTAVGDKVFSFGYPHAQWGSTVMVQQETIIGARVFVKKGSLQIRHVIINQQSVVGQSGAPVYATKSGSVIGILVGVFAPTGGGISLGGIDPHTLHQTSYVVSAEYLTGMLQ
jgi:hypothetical protein